MKKLIFLLAFLLVITISNYTDITLAANQSEDTVSRSGDLCGGTGGNGQIISVGSNTFTLKLNKDGKKVDDNLIVNITDKATIETPTGYISLSDLKIGNRVTLVGDNHRDGTFTADAVVVCTGTQEVNAHNGKVGQVAVRNKNPEAYEKVSGIVNTATILLNGLIWAFIVIFLLLKKNKGFVYILFFTFFYIYLYKVFDYTLLQFQSLLLLQHFVPDLMLNGFKDGTNVNLTPLITLTLDDLNTSLLNILMMIPFGFGLPFLTNFSMNKVVIMGLLVSIIIESLQFITGLMANTTFRVADINDLIFNTIGVATGYILLVGFMRNFRHIFRNWKTTNPILRYIAERPQVNK